MPRQGKPQTSYPLYAILPGAKIDSEKGKVTVNVGISTETLVFNIGGVKFETFRSTLLKQPDCRLMDEEFLQKHYREQTHEYFFDRDPDIFKVILNYLRTGELHLPTFICGPAIKTELEFWGIPDTDIERCCSVTYNSYNSTLEALNQLERDRKGSFLLSDDKESGTTTKLERFRIEASMVLNQPESSTFAKIYGVFSLFVVALSILSFLAESHPSFLVSSYTFETMSVFNDSLNKTVEETIRKVQSVPHPILENIDLGCMVYFTIEYIFRLLVARKRCRYIRSLMGFIDLLALIPDYVQLILLAVEPDSVDKEATKIITILKVTRILRIFRLIRHVPGLWILIYTLKASVRELLLMTAFLMVGMLIFSSLIYYADDRSTFTSIPHGFWWALITMTTVGYGDMYPETEWGYVIGSLTALSGLLMIGFSVPILVSNFLMYYKHLEFALQEEKTIRNKNKTHVISNGKDSTLTIHHNENNNRTDSIYTVKSELNQRL